MINYILKSNITMRKIAEEHFVLDRNNGIIHTFNHSGAFIWENITSNHSFDDIVRNIQFEYEINSEDAKEDVFNFLLTLEKSKLIAIEEAPV